MADAAVSFVLDKLGKWIGPRSTGIGAAAPTGFDIPYEVVKEAIVNGIAHRDYTSTGSVQVELFPDKLLVMSPGKPHPAVDIGHLDKSHPSNPVNPLIADALYKTGHIERLGTGLEDLFKTCRREGLPKPEVAVRGGTFFITIFRKARKFIPSSDAINDAINDAIKIRPGVKKVELVKIIGKSKPTIERAIALLKQQGRIEYRGSKKTGGYYAKG